MYSSSAKSCVQPYAYHVHTESTTCRILHLSIDNRHTLFGVEQRYTQMHIFSLDYFQMYSLELDYLQCVFLHPSEHQAIYRCIPPPSEYTAGT